MISLSSASCRRGSKTPDSCRAGRAGARRRWANERTHAVQRPTFLFDHLVGGDEQASRRSQTESFGRLEIEGGLVLRRSLYRQVGRFGTGRIRST